jgi:DNA-binding transcriptional ArsR family regulator
MDSNTEKEYYARRSIFKALSDKQWHRNMELKATTKLSSRTLAKHLDKMVEQKMIEKKTDIESGKYPHPVLYKALPGTIDYIRFSMFREEFSKNIDAILKETKDPLLILDTIHNWYQLIFLKILEGMQEKKMTFEERDWHEEVILFPIYRDCTFALIEATAKIIDEIDISQLLILQAKRQKILFEDLIKVYEGLFEKSGITLKPETIELLKRYEEFDVTKE